MFYEVERRYTNLDLTLVKEIMEKSKGKAFDLVAKPGLTKSGLEFVNYTLTVLTVVKE